MESRSRSCFAARHLRGLSSPGTRLHAWDCAGGRRRSIHTEEYQSIPGTIARAVQAQQAGYDGILLGCYADPGIDALREMLTIPVAGPFESSAATALTLGHRFSIVTATPEMAPVLAEEVRAKGIAAHRLASVGHDLTLWGLGEPCLRKAVSAVHSTARARMVPTAHFVCISLACPALTAGGQKWGCLINPILTGSKWQKGRLPPA